MGPSPHREKVAAQMASTEQTCTLADSAAPPRRSYRGIVFQAILLMAVWLILSGHYDFLHILYGVISVAAVIGITLRLQPLPLADCEACGTTRIKIFRLVIYLFWLQWQIIKSGFYVAYIVLHPKMPVVPALVRFDCLLPNVLARVILGNSITLTPGTLTTDIRGDRFVVHSLTRDQGDAILEGDMNARVARLYVDQYNPDDLCFNVRRTDDGSRDQYGN